MGRARCFLDILLSLTSDAPTAFEKMLLSTNNNPYVPHHLLVIMLTYSDHVVCAHSNCHNPFEMVNSEYQRLVHLALLAEWND